MRKKILLVIHTPPPFGGGEIQAQTLKDFYKSNDEVVIYDYSRRNHNRKDWDKVKGRVVFHGFFWILKTSFLLIKIRPYKVYFTLPKSFLAFVRNGVVFPLARLLNVKILGELPGTSFLFLEKNRGLKYKIGLYFLKKIDEIRFLSKSIAEEHSKYNFKSYKVIDNGVNIPLGIQVNPTIFDSKVLPLIYVGSIEKSKGILNSIQAILECKKNGINIHFNIVGDWINSIEKEEILGFIKTNALESHITFHGVKTNQEKWNLFRMSAVLIHPTFWDGVPLSILEAMGLGLAVISTSIGGIPDTMKNNYNGLILIENTSKELFLAIKKLNDDRDLIKKMSENNKRDFNERFNLPIFLNNMNSWFLS